MARSRHQLSVKKIPQQPAPVLIGPNSELFGSKLHATKRKTAPVIGGRFRFGMPEALWGNRAFMPIRGGPVRHA
jgi:hypothetical protein